jgi:hypothetical protein
LVTSFIKYAVFIENISYQLDIYKLKDRNYLFFAEKKCNISLACDPSTQIIGLSKGELAVSPVKNQKFNSFVVGL